jgi:hypothetical protein
MKRSQQFFKNRMFFGALFFALHMTFILNSCEKDKVVDDEPEEIVYTARIDLTPKFGTENIKIDSTYVLTDGTKIQFNEIKCYFSDISVGTTNLKANALFDFRLHGSKLIEVNTNPSNGNFSSGIGVPSSVNHNDPSAFPTSSPLNIAIANDMHWSWSPGYIFIKIEARADTIPDATNNFNHYLVYHIGKDENFQNLSIPSISWTNVSATLKQLKLKLDLKDMIENSSNPVDLSTEYTTHSNPGQIAITDKIRQNFLAAISVE